MTDTPGLNIAPATEEELFTLDAIRAGKLMVIPAVLDRDILLDTLEAEVDKIYKGTDPQFREMAVKIVRAGNKIGYKLAKDLAEKDAADTVVGIASLNEMINMLNNRIAELEADQVDQFVEYLERQWKWSIDTFGPALRTEGILDHIAKEFVEIRRNPHDLMEWIDIVILALDGFWRHGGSPTAVMRLLNVKQHKNFARKWPDWRTRREDQAIEHDRTDEPI